MNDLLARFTSRKFLAAVFGVITIVALPRLGIQLSTEELTAFTLLLSAFIGVEGLADVVTRITNIPTIEEPVTKK